MLHTFCGHFQTLASVFSLARYLKLPLFPHHHKKSVSKGRNTFREKKHQIKPTCNLKMFLSITELEEVGFAVSTKVLWSAIGGDVFVMVM